MQSWTLPELVPRFGIPILFNFHVSGSTQSVSTQPTQLFIAARLRHIIVKMVFTCLEYLGYIILCIGLYHEIVGKESKIDYWTIHSEPQIDIMGSVQQHAHD